MARRLERFSELLPELNTDRLFTDFPNIVLMDLKKVEPGPARPEGRAGNGIVVGFGAVRAAPVAGAEHRERGRNAARGVPNQAAVGKPGAAAHTRRVWEQRHP